MVATKGERTRERILGHAARRAAELGLEGLSIGALAKDLGLSKSGLFAHFDSKEALQVAVLDYEGERFTEKVIRPSLQAPRGRARLEAIFDRWVRWPDPGTGCLFLAAVAEQDDREGPVRERLVALQTNWLSVIANVARTAIEEGALDPSVDPGQIAFELNGVMLSYHYFARLLRDPAAGKRARDAFERILSARAPGAKRHEP